MKLCCVPKCLEPVRKEGQRYCRTHHAKKAKAYRDRDKRELAQFRHNATVNHRPAGTDE